MRLNKFTGVLQVGNNLISNCSVTGGTNPGLAPYGIRLELVSYLRRSRFVFPQISSNPLSLNVLHSADLRNESNG